MPNSLCHPIVLSGYTLVYSHEATAQHGHTKPHQRLEMRNKSISITYAYQDSRHFGCSVRDIWVQLTHIGSGFLGFGLKTTRSPLILEGPWVVSE